jgi:hypothetical protein
MRTLIQNALYRHKSSDDLSLYEAFFYRCFHVLSGRCTKIDDLVPNWQTFRTEVQLFTQNSLPRARESNNKQQNQIVAHPTGHGDAHFGPAQQPTNNPKALV